MPEASLDTDPVDSVEITEFTDPGCPWAYSAEPVRWRLDWLYGERLRWHPRMVVLSRSPEDYKASGFTPERQARAFARIAREHGMPIDTGQRPRMAATAPACEAVVGARLNAPAHERPLLRALRIRNFAGEPLDEAATIARACGDAGLDAGEVTEWTAQDAVQTALREDMSAARAPMPAARALDHKLANWSGGRRYTCPSYEIVRRGQDVRIAVPGFQPCAVYEVVLANLVPGLDRRDPPERVEEVLAWAGTPLATREVAAVCEISTGEARERLGRVASERHLGTDGLWSLAG
ncbi:MAG: DsbA family oxidoreductase [Solirubrobacteraceae bacterium]